MASIDQQFVEYIVKQIVEHPDDVIVERTIDEKGVLLTLTVNPEDLGRIIGRRGANAQSLRTLLRTLGAKNTARYNLKIVNNDDAPGVDREETIVSSQEVSTDGDVVETVTEEVVENEPESESDYAKKSRAELADLDDLDI